MSKFEDIEDVYEELQHLAVDTGPSPKELQTRNMVLRYVDQALDLLEKGEPAWRVSHPLNRLKKKLL